MRCICIIDTLFIIFLSLFLMTGCQQDGGEVPPSTVSPPETVKKKPTVEVTIGGKVWKIDPNLSYQATGIWTNPNPRPLTEAEKERLQTLPALVQTLGTQLDELEKELSFLNSIEETQVKIRYSFGKPPHFSPEGKPKIIDLGEFPMEIDRPAKIPSEQ